MEIILYYYWWWQAGLRGMFYAKPFGRWGGEEGKWNILIPTFLYCKLWWHKIQVILKFWNMICSRNLPNKIKGNLSNIMLRENQIELYVWSNKLKYTNLDNFHIRIKISLKRPK